MAREYEYVVSEVQRIADLLGVDSQDPSFTRSSFLNFIPTQLSDLPTNVTKHDLFIHGGFARLKSDASVRDGTPSPQRNANARGAHARVLYTRKLERELATRDFFLKSLKAELRQVFRDNPPQRCAKPVKVHSGKTVVPLRTVLLSDLHFGVFVEPHDVLGSAYNWQIAARRLAQVCKEAVQDKVQDLRIVLAGDIVHGVIHLSESNLRPITEQLCGAAAILTEAIDYMARRVKGVTTVVCIPGNHDRMVYKSPQRALSQRWDSYATLLYLTLKSSFNQTDYIKFRIPAAGIASVPDLTGGTMLIAHGDVEPSSGNVGSSINVKSIKDAILKMRDNKVLTRHVSVAMFGHWHTPTLQMLPDGSYLVVNGSLIGADPYSQNALGVFNAMPAQVMFDTTSKSALTNFRIVQVRDADDQEDLDDIISTPDIIRNGDVV